MLTSTGGKKRHFHFGLTISCITYVKNIFSVYNATLIEFNIEPKHLMTATSTLTTRTSISPLSIWLIGVSFVLFQFFLQLSSGVIIGSIMQDMNLSALVAGLLSSSFYLIYTTLQIPAGILFDRKNTRLLLATNALLCSIGCLIFAKSMGLPGLFLGRTLIGAGSAFAFVGLSHLLRQYFPEQRFAFMIGLSETLGFIATAIGIIGMGNFVSHYGWRTFINAAALIGVVITYLCFRFIPNSEPHPIELHYKRQLFAILANKKLWLNGLYAGLSFSMVTVFGALWAVPFLQIKLNCNMQTASVIGATFFLGAGLSCPLFGIISNHVTHRRRLILWSCLSTAFMLLLVLYMPTHNALITACCMFMTGLLCGAYMLAYSISNELTPPHLQSTATGFTNTLAVLFAPLLQPLVGYLLDTFCQTGIYSLVDYQKALLVIPLALIVASGLVMFLPERRKYPFT